MKMILNHDKDYVLEMRESIKKNGGHCPCIVLKDESIKCPCVDFRTKSLCHCELYVEDNDGK